MRCIWNISTQLSKWAAAQLQIRMSKIELRLREREEARKASVAARRLEKEKDTRAEETSEYFTEQFSRQKAGSYIHSFTV